MIYTLLLVAREASRVHNLLLFPQLLKTSKTFSKISMMCESTLHRPHNYIKWTWGWWASAKPEILHQYRIVPKIISTGPRNLPTGEKYLAFVSCCSRFESGVMIYYWENVVRWDVFRQLLTGYRKSSAPNDVVYIN